MKLRLMLFAGAAAMMAAACSNEDEVAVNPDPRGDALTFSTSVGHSTRATETTIDNLGNFAVVARGMHPDGVLYDNYLIGSGTAGEVAKREGTSSTWKLDRNVYWPSTFEQVMFFAYTTLKDGDPDTDTPLYSGSSFGFENKNPFIEGYAPKKADLTATSNDDATVWADGKVQKDLLVAYTKQSRSKNATTVNLNFKHALTQISITAKQKDKTDNDHRIVKIKGAWVVNAAKSGKLLGDLKYNSTTKESSDSLSWTGTDKTAYGSFYNQIVTLEKTNSMDLLRPEGTTDDGSPILGSLMLVPEDLTAWGKSQNDEGAYILLLCRVELKHTGATHEGDADMSDIYTEGSNHYHQLFPVNASTYNAAEYGFVCVPLSSEWNSKGIGRHYTYNLDICGETTGAGFYPPEFKEEFINGLIPSGSKVGNANLSVVTTRPDTKKVGDPVLDGPIKFSVTVNSWDAPENEWKPGNGDF